MIETIITQTSENEVTKAEETTATQESISEIMISSETSVSYGIIDDWYDSDNGEVSAPPTTFTEIHPHHTDYVVFGGILYSNNSKNEMWAGKYEVYTKGDFFDEVLINSDERNIYKIEDCTASLMPVGTKFYECNESSELILADTPDGLIPFLMIVEG
jgi:hypothetical protein